MSDKKITELPDGGAVQSTDEFVAARAGGNVKIAGSAVGGSGSLLTHTTTLTAAQIRNLNIDLGAAAEILPAPGANKAIVPFAFALAFNPGTTPYAAEDSSTALWIAYATNPTYRQITSINMNRNFPSSVPALASLLGSTVKRFRYQPANPALGSGLPGNAPYGIDELDAADANCGLVIYATVLMSGGPATAAHVAAGGSGYAPGDTFRVISPENTYAFGIPPQGDCQCTVLTVSGGAVATFSINGGGINFIAGQTYATEHDTGSGDDALTVTIDTAPEGDGTLSVTSYYAVVDL